MQLTLAFFPFIGTGTPVGDPIEVNSLGVFFRNHRVSASGKDGYRLIGSVKTNIGHLESGAGAASLIKVLLMMRQQQIVPSLLSDTLNPKIDFETYKLHVPHEDYNWPALESGSRWACVNCFGFGGTNSHAVIKQFTPNLSIGRSLQKPEWVSPNFVVITAKTATALVKNITHLRESIEANPDIDLEALSFTTTCKRDHFRFRACLATDSMENLISQCAEQVEKLEDNAPTVPKSSKVIFAFCGVGTTWIGMGYDLLEKEVSPFVSAVQEIDHYLVGLAGWSIEEKLRSKDEMKDPMTAHIAIFTCQVGIFTFWTDIGLQPQAIVGQSVGEVAAAYAAGCLSLEDAVKVIYTRSKVLANATGGSMCVVRNVDTEVVAQVCSEASNGRVNIAVHSSPVACTISGDGSAVEEVKETLGARFTSPVEKPILHPLEVQCAYHSHQVDNAAEEFLATVDEITHMRAKLPIFSSVTGLLADENFASKEYWGENIKNPVMFSQVLQLASEPTAFNIIVEVGPKPVLRAHLPDIFPATQSKSCPSMLGNKGLDILYQTLIHVFCLGVDLEWRSLVTKELIPTSIPKYQFERQKLFTESDIRVLRKQGLMGDANKTHLMITRKPDFENFFKIEISPTSTFFVYNHIIDGAVVLPGATYTEIAYELGTYLLEVPAESLVVSYHINKAVAIQPGKSYDMDLTAEITDEDGIKNVHFRASRDETIFAYGDISERTIPTTRHVHIKDFKDDFPEHVEGGRMYADLQALGYRYEPPVQVLTSIHYNKLECFGEIKLTEEVYKQITQTSFHPSVLDAMLHSSALMFLKGSRRGELKIYPTGFSSIVVRKQMERNMYCFTRSVQNVGDKIYTNLVLTQEDGFVIAELKEVEHTVLDTSVHVNALAYLIDWKKEEFPKQITEDNETNVDKAEDDKIENDTTGFDETKVMLLSCNDTMINEMYNILPDAAKCCLPLNTDSNLVADQLDDFFEDIEDMEALVFAPGFNISRISSEQSGLEVMNYVKFTCNVFLHTMKKLKSTNKTVFVVTENTQVANADPSTNMNVFGAELWGFSRSLMQEGCKCRIVLTDIQPSIYSEQSNLRSLIGSVMDGEMKELTECILRYDEMYVDSLMNRKQSGMQKDLRNFELDETCDVELRSSKPDTIHNSFFVHKEITDVKSKEQWQAVFMEKLLLHTHNEFPITEADNNMDEKIWAEYNESGYPVIALEFEGYRLNRNDPKNTSDKVVACYPLKVKKIVDVPPSCIIDKSDVDNYTPGKIKSTILAMKIASAISKRSNVGIIATDANTNTDAQMLKAVLENGMQCSVKFLDKEVERKQPASREEAIQAMREAASRESEAENNEEFNATVVVVISPSLDRILIDALSNNAFNKLTHVVAFHDTVLKNTRQIVQFRKTKVKFVTLDKQTIFEPRNIVKMVPEARKWLKERKKSGCSIEDSEDISNNSQTINTMSLLNQKEKESPITVKASKTRFVRKEAVYIVIGGLSGLGWEIVKWLGRNGAGVVVSFSRRSPDQQMIQNMDSIMEMHAITVKSVICDVSNLQSVKEAFKMVDVMFPSFPVKGVFQGAGILRDALVESMTMDSFEQVLQPKVLGTWNLHLVTKNLQLDYFVMHSSIASVFGNAGQTNYSSANAFMDSLAHYRRSLGIAGQSINWSALMVGMAADETIMNNLKGLGYYPLETTKIMDCLNDALITNPVQIVYGLFDWTTITKNSAKVALLKLNANEISSTAATNASRSKGNKITLDIAKFTEMTHEEQYAHLLEMSINIISKVLSMEPGDLGEEICLVDLGMESQKATEFIQIFYDSTGIRIPVAYLISPEYSIKMIVEFAHESVLKNLNKDEDEEDAETEHVENALSYMEKYYKDLHTSDSTNPGMWFSIDFKLGPNFSRVDLWKKMQRWLAIKHPELRTFHKTTIEDIRFGIKKNLLDPEESKINLIVVDRKTFDLPTCDEHHKFDPDTESPLRIMYDATGKKHRVRFIMSHTAFDLQCFFVLLRDLETFLYTSLALQQIPDLTPNPFIDIASIMEERLEMEKMGLEHFWRSQLKKVGEAVTLSQPVRQPSKNVGNIEKRLSESVTEKVLALTSVTPVQMFCGLYQLLLHKLTGNPVIPVTLCTDMRMHFPEVARRVFLGTNYVPVISEFNDEQSTLNDHVNNAATQLRAAYGNSLFPYALMQEMPEYKSHIHRHHINFREFMFSKDDKKKRYRGYWMKYLDYHVEFMNDMETAFLIHHEKNRGTMTIHLQYDKDIIDDLSAERMLDDLYFLASVYVERPSFHSSDVPLESVQRHMADGDNRNISTGNVLFDSLFLNDTAVLKSR